MSKTKITVNSNGSLKVEGDFEVVDNSAFIITSKGLQKMSFDDIYSEASNLPKITISEILIIGAKQNLSFLIIDRVFR